MSNISSQSLRIASKTRCFETSGDSSYYYSNQLLSNLAFLKIASTLGQQISWPSKPPLSAPPTKQGSSFLAKANSKNTSSRLEPQINLNGTPGKEWLSANEKLVDKLRQSQQFFHSKAFGLLAKTLGRCGRFDSLYSYNGILQKSQIYAYKKTKLFPTFVNQNKFKTKDHQSFFSNFYISSLNPTFPLVSLSWLKRSFFGKENSFDNLQSLSTSFNPKGSSVANQVQAVKEFPQEKTETLLYSSLKLPEKNKFPNLNLILPLAKPAFLTKKKSSFTLSIANQPSKVATRRDEATAKELLGPALKVFAVQKKSILKQGKNKSKQPYEKGKIFSSSNSVNLNPLSLSATVHRKTLLPSISKRLENKAAFITPFGLPFYLGCLGLISHCQVLKSSLAITPVSCVQSNISLANNFPVIKTTSSSGIGLVSASPRLYILRNHKSLLHYFFFRIPFKFAEKKSKKKAFTQTVYLTAKLQGMQKLHKRAKPFYASVRWL
uniref:Uncharacterized protein n=1 Tax=Gloeotilopsis planctonica TaxID=34157 RepID=A0A1B2RZ11_9CHLO|nr:hypothetical protein [Gloeotilopsis planctonica]